LEVALDFVSIYWQNNFFFILIYFTGQFTRDFWTINIALGFFYPSSTLLLPFFYPSTLLLPFVFGEFVGK
jgi:hypothetical protein